MMNQFMPEYRLRQIDRVRVKSRSDQAWALLRNFDLNELPLSHLLFDLRNFPHWVIESFREQRLGPEYSGKINDFTGPGRGFQILSETPGVEIVIGSIGKFWRPDIFWAKLTPENFSSFSEPGFGKLVWSLRIDPDAHGGSWMSWELRVTTTDAASWRSFRTYWLAIGSFSHGLRKLALRHFRKQLGGKVSEEDLSLLGDDLVVRPQYQRTMGVTIETPPSKIWPWLVQMGCQRAGWYSLDLLDNAGRPSAQTLQPDLQKIKVGDILSWQPDRSEGFTVLSMEENWCLILGSKADSLVDTWAFILEPIGTDATRLLTRVRADFEPSLAWKIRGLGYNFAHVLMERVQLKNLKQRAESLARQEGVVS
jgi:hypothetical protein